MKILLLSPLPPPAGGIATWTKLFFESEESKKHILDIINTSVTGSRVENFNQKRIKGEIVRTYRIFSQLIKKTKTLNYDIAHINNSCSMFGMIRDYLCAKYSKLQKIKLIIHFHCDTKYMVKGYLSEYIFKKLCRVADKIYCLNTSSQEHIKLLTKKEGIIIPNFINLEITDNCQLEISDKLKKIIYVGHIVFTKGCADIIAVAEQMPNINFKMVGFISEELSKIPIPKNVEYTGEVTKSQVFELMLDSDLLLFPTHTEGFPNVVLEAMAFGLPIITTPVGAIPDMIEDKGGVIVKIGDVDGMVNAIKILDNKEIRIGISKWNKNKVKNKYEVETVANTIFREYSRD